MNADSEFEWLDVQRADEPVIVTFPHTGTEIPRSLTQLYTSVWHARRDTDWWVHLLYRFVRELGVTTVRTRISRSVIDVNRDPSGASLYPGQAVTELCPTTDFDGAPLYRGKCPDSAEVALRRQTYFDPYHSAVAGEIRRLRTRHANVVLYDAHSIRSSIPRLFEGELPLFNIGTNNGTTCDQRLSDAIERICATSNGTYVKDGRFKGGWTTRHYGVPELGIHSIQMELAQRSYMPEPAELTPANWPSAMRSDAEFSQSLSQIIKACIAFAKGTK